HIKGILVVLKVAEVVAAAVAVVELAAAVVAVVTIVVAVIVAAAAVVVAAVAVVVVVVVAAVAVVAVVVAVIVVLEAFGGFGMSEIGGSRRREPNNDISAQIQVINNINSGTGLVAFTTRAQPENLCTLNGKAVFGPNLVR
ncbi:hypothetical protein ElyMa_006462000, partial [Elysia marginata]